MPNRKKMYVDMERYAKTRRAQRQRYYEKTNNKYPSRPWTEAEDKLVLAHSITDTELSAVIEKSVKAIQLRRYKLKHTK